MALHKPRFLRRLWSLSRNAEEAWCEVWLDGADFEARLITSGHTLVRERMTSEMELEQIQSSWRSDMMALGWKDVQQ
jgi:hypothetical protein